MAEELEESKLEEIVWLGKRFSRSSDGSNVQPMPIGHPIFLAQGGKTHPDFDSDSISEKAREYNFYDNANAYSIHIDHQPCLAGNVKVTAIQLYKI